MPIESSAPRSELQGVLAASYQYGYRLALLVAGAGALYVAEYGSWTLAYTAMSGCMLVGIATTLWCREGVTATVRSKRAGSTSPYRPLGEACGHRFPGRFLQPLRPLRPGHHLVHRVLPSQRLRARYSREPVLPATSASARSQVASVAKTVRIIVIAWSVLRAAAGPSSGYGIARCLICQPRSDREHQPVFCEMVYIGADLLDAHRNDQLRQFREGIRRDRIHRVPVEPRQPFVHGDAVRADEFPDECSRQVQCRVFRQCPGGRRLRWASSCMPPRSGLPAITAVDGRREAPRSPVGSDGDA